MKKILTRCPICQKEEIFEVNEEDFNKWQNGMYIQDAFPYLDASLREQLLSGVCPTCWDKEMQCDEDLY